MKDVSDLLNKFQTYCSDLEDSISNVRYGPVENYQRTIYFDINGVIHKGILIGENAGEYLNTKEPNSKKNKLIVLRIIMCNDFIEIGGA